MAGDEMLKYILVKENGKEVMYKYFPEGGKLFGTISFDKESKTCSIHTLAPNDEHNIYALKMFKCIREFASTNHFRQDGIVAWG